MEQPTSILRFPRASLPRGSFNFQTIKVVSVCQHAHIGRFHPERHILLAPGQPLPIGNKTEECTALQIRYLLTNAPAFPLSVQAHLLTLKSFLGFSESYSPLLVRLDQSQEPDLHYLFPRQRPLTCRHDHIEFYRSSRYPTRSRYRNRFPSMPLTIAFIWSMVSRLHRKRSRLIVKNHVFQGETAYLPRLERLFINGECAIPAVEQVGAD